MLAISKRVSEMQASPIRKLVPLANQAKSRGISVFHLNIGQPDLPTPPAYWEAVHKFEDKVLAYGPSEGLLFLREAIAGYFERYDISVDKDEILITTAGSEAVQFALLTIADEGDEVIVPEPFYTNYNGFASIAGVKLKPIRTLPETGFHLPSQEEIECKISPRTKGILICSPNNPTGTILDKEEMEMLAELALEHNLYLLSDEVYREFSYGTAPISILSFPRIADRVIMLDSISKRFSACGARIGCMIIKNMHVRSEIMKLAQSRLCPPTLEQYGAAAAYSLPESYYNSVKEEYKKRRDVVLDGLCKISGCLCQEPKGAFYVMAQLPIDDADKFAAWLLTEFSVDNKTVMLAPGAGFYATPGLGLKEVRIAYVLEQDKLREAMDLLKIAIEKYKQII
ncbi:MAG: pyridoxal phosphate-dependent aminotransferase [Candidatus Coatesbacteria bacterium]|nr:pyridoxal phosphate-dependent aminotransferase [Candidatus Coatesbacteria bacterium]